MILQFYNCSITIYRNLVFCNPWSLDSIVFTNGIAHNSALMKKITILPNLIIASACKDTINGMPEEELLRWENEGGKAKI
jgi:acetate kinase